MLVLVIMLVAFVIGGGILSVLNTATQRSGRRAF
jgi:hypothetical protein